MGRQLRTAFGSLAYHVLNRSNGRMRIFEDDSDYKAFEQVMIQACEHVPMRILSYCVMPQSLAHGALAGKRWNLSRFVAWLSALRIRNADMLIGIAPDPATYIRAGLSPL